jgi:hypothetical protein
VRKADNLQLSSADVTESGGLNLPEPSGPHRSVMGMLYPYVFYFININSLQDSTYKVVQFVYTPTKPTTYTYCHYTT